MREAQLGALRLPDTRMAVTIDLGEANDLHPQNKKDIALRLLLGVRELVYGESVTAQGPLFERLSAGGALRISSAVQKGALWPETANRSGLKSAESMDLPSGAGGDRGHSRACGILRCQNLPVRYAWRDNPEGANLYNAEGLPASPFRA